MSITPREPSLENAKIRIALVGETGSGKSHFILQMPKPLVIDCETSADMFANRGFKPYRVIEATEAGDVGEAVAAILDGRSGFECGTMGLDSITAFMRMCQIENGAIKEQYKNATVYRRMTTLMSRLYNGGRPCHVVVTAHEKTLFGKDQAVLGKTWDADPRFGFPFDLIVRMTKTMDGKIGPAIILKSRLKALPAGMQIPNFSPAHVAQAMREGGIEKTATTTDVPTSNVAPAAETAPTATAPAIASASNAATTDRPPAASGQRPKFDEAQLASLQKLADVHARVGKPNRTLREYMLANQYPSSVTTFTRDVAQNVGKSLEALVRIAS